MNLSKPQLLILLLSIVLVLVGGFYWLHHSNDADDAGQRLAAQNIDINTDNFFKEIKADHPDNVRDFILSGANAALQDASGESALMIALGGGNKDITSLLLSSLPANPQEAAPLVNLPENTAGKTALIMAVEKDDKESVKALLAHGADTSIANKKQETPLIIAVKNKYADLLQPLIAADESQHKGASINNEDSSGETPLTYAIKGQEKEIVDELIVAKADPVSADRGGVSPLMIAAESGNTDIGRRLIEMGTKMDAADQLGNSPLSISIRHSHPAFAEMLLAQGANPDFHTIGPLPLEVAINTEPFDPQLFTLLLTHSKQGGSIGPSALFSAIDHKSTEAAKALLDHGINARATNAAGETLLYQAIEKGLEDLAILLIDKGADIYQTGLSGITPVERAVRHNEIKVVGKLLTMGVQPNQKTAEGYTLAEMAVYSGYPQVLDALLAKGAKLEKDFGVLWAIRDGGGRAVPVLLKYGAHPNVMSNSGDSALWLAASTGETDAVAALIQYHAALDYPNTAQGTTPLAIASNGGQLAAVKLLVEAGASLEKPDAAGMTPLAHAAYMAKPDVVEYLIGKGANVHATDAQGRSVTELAALGEATAARDRVLLLLQKK